MHKCVSLSLSLFLTLCVCVCVCVRACTRLVERLVLASLLFFLALLRPVQQRRYRRLVILDPLFG